jgi:hypothetical protein
MRSGQMACRFPCLKAWRRIFSNRVCFDVSESVRHGDEDEGLEEHCAIAVVF